MSAGLSSTAADSPGHQALRAATVLFVVATLAAAVYGLRFLVTPALLGLLIRYCLSPMVDALEDHGVSRALSVALCFLFGTVATVALGVALWPALESWLVHIPKTDSQTPFEVQIEGRLEEWAATGQATWPGVDWERLFFKAKDTLARERRDMMETLPTVVLAALGNVGTILLAPIIGLFLLVDGEAMHRRLISWVPNRYFETTLVLIHRVDRQIAAYLRGTAAESGLVAMLLTGLLYGVGMPYALLFGCIYGVANVIPLAGPLLGAGTGVLFSMLEPAAPSLPVLLVCYAVVYVLDAVLVNPLVVGKSLNLHPLTIILGLTLGGRVAGVPGMIVSVPTLAVLSVVVTTLALEMRRKPA
jgi:predicted PurR-regulated permease PerM